MLLSQSFYQRQCRWIVWMQENRVWEEPRSQHCLLQTVLSACRFEVVLNWLWESSFIHYNMLLWGRWNEAMRCCFIKLHRDKSNFALNIWSNYSLCGDYLGRGLSHSTVTGSWTCAGQETLFFSCAIFYKIPPAHRIHLDRGTKGGYLFIRPSYIFLLYQVFSKNQCLTEKFPIDFTIKFPFLGNDVCLWTRQRESILTWEHALCAWEAGLLVPSTLPHHA